MTVYEGALHADIVAWRAAREPSVTIGLGSSFPFFARAPFVAADQGTDATGAPLPGPGVLPPVAGLLVPLYRQPLNAGRLALRVEVAAPLGSPEQFRGNGATTARALLVYGENLGRRVPTRVCACARPPSRSWKGCAWKGGQRALPAALDPSAPSGRGLTIIHAAFDLVEWSADGRGMALTIRR